MKKSIIFTTVFTLVFTLQSCKDKKSTEAATETTETTEPVKDSTVSVTKDNFAYAMTDMAMQKEFEQGGDNKFNHHRKPMPLDEQPAPLMNRDTNYSFAILDGKGDVAITLPKNDGRYMSLHIMNHEHITYKVYYGPGRYVIPASKTTDFFYANVRIQINPKDPADIKKVNDYQDQLKIEFLNGYKPRSFKATNWNMKEFDEVRKGYVEAAQKEGVQGTMGTEDKPVSLEARNRGVAIATGLLPDKEAIYLTAKHEAEKGKSYKAVYKVPELRDPKLGFYSITVYGDDQYLKTDQGSIISNKDVKLNPDGKTFDLYFVPEAEFGKGKHANEVIIPTQPFWTCTRVYMPGESVTNGSYKLPVLTKI
ncbi:MULTISPECIES: DUF1254 domain-containing protein [Flavobacterium]|uniref:Murein transglycosylase n=1 Tax=Flavobacterium frigidimaris TaxID=262320 RepID=A0ABX4BM38_FLAFR|nr:MULTISPECIES: DUF1254 domain-containing protein [Flavobacterium]MBJ2127289.1 DUF1254 domain-containing protein [Flavobacterium sp. IB48]OXA76541.1 murein transglycosylase [Flavobacterium frigidimaris]SDZ66904.1 Protein of unknown function [Flavobacterium aquidurense]